MSDSQVPATPFPSSVLFDVGSPVSVCWGFHLKSFLMNSGQKKRGGGRKGKKKKRRKERKEKELIENMGGPCYLTSSDVDRADIIGPFYRFRSQFGELAIGTRQEVGSSKCWKAVPTRT